VSFSASMATMALLDNGAPVSGNDRTSAE